MHTSYRQHSRSRVTVSTTVLRVGGASNWTGALFDAASLAEVGMSVCNNDAANTVYLAFGTRGAAVTGAVSATDYDFKLGPGVSVPVLLAQNQDLFVVAPAGDAAVRVTMTIPRD